MAGRKEIQHSEEWWSSAPAHAVQCSGNLKSTGERCRRAALPGAPVCRYHGGTLPAVQQAAATRIGLSLDDAVKRLLEMLDDPQVEAREKTKILHDLLDRGGLGATNKVLVGIASADPVEQLFRDILSREDGLAPAVPVAAERVYGGDGEDSPLLALESGFSARDEVVDAEVVEDAPAHVHTVYIGEAPKTPKHIREALARIL